MGGFVEVQLNASVDAAELVCLLEQSGALGAWEDNGRLRLYWTEESWASGVLPVVRAAVRQLGGDPDSAGFTVASIPDQDWNTRWTQTICPIRLGRSILVRQSWNAGDPSFEGIELVVDPKRAFGSGYHATTQLLVEWLEDSVRGGERVLDVGTGSGILSMVALRLGARSALGIDNDPAAIECARENAESNGFGPELELKAASLEEPDAEAFDLIVANLDRNTLQQYAGSLLKQLTPNGKALLSGLQEEDAAEISRAVMASGGRVRDRRVRDEWVALEIMR